jgi:ACS family hexuronate transporter-like MFS transporter
MFWIPKYLNESQLLTLQDIGNILWIPFLALGFGNLLGGWFSDLIFKRTSNTDAARKIVMGIAAAITIPMVSVGFLNSTILIIVLMALAFFAHGLWITNYITSIGDIFGNSVTSTVVGLSGSAGAISSLVLNPLIGLVVVHYSYSPLWWYVGLMYPVAFLLLIGLIPKIESKSLSKI